MSVDPLDDLLFAITLFEGGVCLACAFMVVLVVPYAHHHHRLQSHLALFAVAAVALVLTTALADAYHSLRQRRTHR